MEPNSWNQRSRSIIRIGAFAPLALAATACGGLLVTEESEVRTAAAALTEVGSCVDDSVPGVHVKVAVCRSDTAVRNPTVDCSLDTAYALVGGGAYAAYSGAGALLTESRPLDGRTWRAASKDTSTPDAHFLYTYAVGMRLDGVNVESLRGMISRVSKVSSGTVQQPVIDDFSVPGLLSGGAATSNSGLWLQRAGSNNPLLWRAAAKTISNSPGQVTAWASSLGQTKIIEGFGALEVQQKSGNFTSGTGALTVNNQAVDSGYALLGYAADSSGWDASATKDRFVTRMGPTSGTGACNARAVVVSSKDQGGAVNGGLTAWWSEARKRANSHGLCNIGTALAADMDPCVASVCAARASCCSSSWDATCVGQVTSTCGKSCADYSCSLPAYHPSFWNDAGVVQYNNNCYNYSTNHRTDTFAQPGRASGEYCFASSCLNADTIGRYAQNDGLIPTTASGTCPDNRDKIALVIAPGWDYHWYRRDTNGMWTHKPGGTQATNLDNSGNTIANPETADRGWYTVFAGYFCACSSSVEGQGHTVNN